jgi:hypothetical protein
MPPVLHYLSVDMRRRRHWFRYRFSQTVFIAGRWLCCLMALLAGATVSQAQTADVDIELDQFGVMSHYRPGDLTGIRLMLENNPLGSLGEAATVLVQIELPNADGDIVEYGSIVTLTRGRPTPVWLYLPIPPEFDRDGLMRVRVFEMRDERRYREIAGQRIGPRDVTAQQVPITAGMIAVIGQRRMGLQDYAWTWDQFDRSPASHEPVRIVSGIRPDALPDAWEAWKGFEAVAIADETTPRMLTRETAGALREYVRRGGHLIINIPEDTNPWQFGIAGQHPLEDMLPRTEPRKDEAVPMRELVPVLSKARTTDIERVYGIRVFKELRGDFDVIDNHYEPVIALQDGRVVVVRRNFGHGWITVTGIDLSQQTLFTIPLSNGTNGMPQADAFWNRILGRRIDTPVPSELQSLRDAELLVRSTPGENNLDGGRLFNHYVAMTTQAGRGLLLALLIFAAYWLLAGPGGFGILKMYGKIRHSWLMFAFISIAFTAVAYACVQLIRMTGDLDQPQIRHITYLDHIARPELGERPEDPQLQRAASWFSLYTPGYGQTPVRINSMSGQRDILSSWTPPPPETLLPFPNVDRYQVDVRRSPASYTIPSRSTATQMYANWMGGLDRDWGRMIHANIDHPIDVVIRPYDEGRREEGLRGVLTHDLPGTLRDVTVIWITNERFARRYMVDEDRELRWVAPLRSGSILNRGFIERTTPWAPGESLDLSELQFRPADAGLDINITRRYVEEYRQTGLRPAITTVRDADRRRFLEMLSFFHQLTPPQYFKSRRDADEPTGEVVFQRLIGREVDLSTWFTRPCLIIMGYLENSPLPPPLRVNDADRQPSGSGLTLVRWIYPLPLEEDIAFPPPLEHDEDIF